MDLDQFQNLALDAFNSRNHVAILGAAGTGKSHVLVKIIQKASTTYGSSRSVACAWTNNAARNINGITLHKLFSAKINWEWTGEGLWEQIKGKRRVLAFLLELKVIIIDEIFTIKSNVFDAIDFVFRRLVKVSWHAGLSMGGRLLVVSGDPFQLEPIFPSHEKEARTVIDSSPWYHCFGDDASGVVVILPDNHRQASDPRFFSILSRLRVGVQSSEDLKELNHTSQEIATAPKTHTRLVLTHDEAAYINHDMLQDIKADSKVSHAFDRVFTTSWLERRQTKDRLDQAAPEKIVTKIGARVLLTRKIEGFFPGTDLVVVNIRRYYLNGGNHQAEALECVPYLPNDISSFGNERDKITLVPMRTPIHSVSGELLAYREQLPIVPAYAITVHRSQSLSLQRVAIDFRGEVNNRWNPYGKVYVALSRCTTLQGLWVRGLRNDHISISPSARQLMDDIELVKREVPNRVISKTLVERSPNDAAILGMRNQGSARSRSPQCFTQSRTTKRIRLDKENIA